MLLYLPGLFTLTHMPIPDFVRRAGVSDKSLHFIAYLILVFLIWYAFYPEKKVNWRRKAPWLILFIICCYAIFDEWLQGRMGRNASFADFVADVGGALTGLIAFCFFDFLLSFMFITAVTIFLMTNLSRVTISDIVPIPAASFYFFSYLLFTLLWTSNTTRYFGLNKHSFKRLMFISAGPVLLILFVKLFSVILQRDFKIQDMIICASGSAVAGICVYIKSFCYKNAQTKDDTAGIDN